MTDGLQFDEEVSRKVEATYLRPDVVMQRCDVLKALRLKPGEHVLDIGCGPGLLAHDMAKTIGTDGRVCCVDLSEPMLAMSRTRCSKQPWVAFEQADATKLPFADDSFDAAVLQHKSTNMLQTFQRRLLNSTGVLRPGGRAVILDTDYDSLVSYVDNQKRMQRILAAWDEHFVHAGLPRVLSSELRSAGFAVWRREVLPIFNPEYHTNTYYGLVGFMASFAVRRKGVTQDEADAWVAELDEQGKQGRYFFSLNRYVFVAV